MSSSDSTSSPTQYRAIGLCLAIGSGLLIGSSFVFKKKGLLRTQAGGPAGEGVGYLKSPIWWIGMIMMIAGETCNFGAYAFVEAIVVTPMGALSVVISAVLSHYFLREKLTLFGWIGCCQCILGALLIALNAPQEQTVTTIDAFKKLFLSPGFLVYGGLCIVASLIIIFYFAPKYGKKSMMWYILVCSMIGGISVSCTSGLGACILTTIRGDNQFKNWFIYFLIFFVACTLLTEIYYLNVALALFNTAMVTPTYYVLFTFFTLVSSVVLYQGLKASVSTILTIAFSFLVICSGIVILQMSRVDPKSLSKVDRKTTILLQAAREEIRPHGEHGDEENLLEATEEPGMDALAGRFSGIGGTFVRARRRTTVMQNHRAREKPVVVSTTRKGKGHKRPGSASSAPCPTVPRPSLTSQATDASAGMNSMHAQQLHQMWRDEVEEAKAAGDDRTSSYVNHRPVGERDPEKAEYEHVVFPGSSLAPGHLDLPPRFTGEEMGRVLSDGPMVASPTASGTGVHFRPDSQNSSGSSAARARPSSSCSNSNSALLVLHGTKKGKKGKATKDDVKSKPRLPELPQPALTPQGNTSGLLNLNIPTPSLHLPHFLSRRSKSQAGKDADATAAKQDDDVPAVAPLETGTEKGEEQNEKGEQ